MSNQEKLKTLEEKIRSLCPELQEQKYEEPIRLNHVLLVLARSGEDVGVSTSLRSPDLAHMFPQGKSVKKEKIQNAGIDFGEVDTRQAQYNLTNDRLDFQSEELINFLYEIICE